MVRPPIHEAAYRGNLEEVLRLIQQDPQLVNSIDEYQNTPLFYASKRGHVSVVAALVDHGADIDHQNLFGETALYRACFEGRVPVVELLMDKGADPKLPDVHNITPFMVAIGGGHVGAVRRLLQHPSVLPTINQSDEFGLTPLHRSCTRGDHEVVKMLLSAGADPTIRNEDDETAMDRATERGRQECVSLLEEWDRSYIIAKARLLYDANYCYQQQGGGASTSSTGGGGQASKVEGAVMATCLRGRLPRVEMVDYEEESLVESVLEYVICGGLKGELFVEFMEMLGKTGVREKKEGEEVA